MNPLERFHHQPAKSLHHLPVQIALRHPTRPPDSTQIVAIRSNGVTADSHKSIPCLTNGFYALISVPHVDKLGMEKITHWSARWSEGSWKDGEPEVHILLQDWEARYKAGEEIPDL